MATVAELERLNELLDRLGPLAAKQRGELIEAEDWNLVVGSLIELSRATVDDDNQGVPPHEHPDEVGIGWLDPRVRDLVTGGGLKDPGLETQLLKIQKELASLRDRLDRLASSVDQSRGRVEEVATKDLVRERELVTLNRKVLGAADDRGEIADLRTTLRTIETEVTRAVEVGARLERNGEPIDVPSLADRVDEFDVVRDRLTQPNGELLDAIAFEQRLNEVQTTLVTEEDLTTALADFRDDVGAGQVDLDPILAAARAESREIAEATVAVRDVELRGLIDTRFAAVPAQVDEAVAAATSSLTDAILDRTRSERSDEIGNASEALRSQLSGAFETRLDATLARVDETLAGVPGLVADQVGGEVQVAVREALSGVDQQLAETAATLDRLAAGIGDNAQTIKDISTSFERARREDTQRELELRDQLLGRIVELEGSFDGKLELAVGDARSGLRAELDSLIGATRRDLLTQLATAARTAAATEVGVLSGSLRTDLQSVVRQEMDVTMAGIREEMMVELGGLQQRMAGMVANEVGRATAELPRLVRDSMNAFEPEIRRIVDNRIGRGPIA